jgi:hypothetical protein
MTEPRRDETGSSTKKGWIADILSPSNLWTAFQYFFPASAGAVSAGLSWVAGLPASVTMGLALITAACAIIIFDFARRWFDQRNFQSQRIAELEERLKPRIEVLNVHEERNAVTGLRTFELEVRNTSETELANCLAKVTDINVFKLNPDGRQDYSSVYARYLPLALKTSRNLALRGGGPFHLRANESKKIPVCSRQDGFGRDLEMHFEEGAPDYMTRITMISECSVEVTIFGAASPPAVNIRFKLENGALTKSWGISGE